MSGHIVISVQLKLPDASLGQSTQDVKASNQLLSDFADEITNARRLGYQQTLKTDTAWNGENGASKVQIVAIKEGR